MYRSKEYTDHGTPAKIYAEAKLTRMGNAKPYFSVTATVKERGREVAGGCMHEEIEKHFPGVFTDLIKLHLSTNDGIPMYCIANGYYWLAGAFGGWGEEYHGGSGKEGRPTTECLGIAADHFRITIDEARALGESVGGDKAKLVGWVETQKSRWKAEADKAAATLTA